MLDPENAQRRGLFRQFAGIGEGFDVPCCAEPVIAEDLAEAVAGSVGPAGDDRTLTVFLQGFDVGDQRIEDVDVTGRPFGGKGTPLTSGQIDDLLALPRRRHERIHGGTCRIGDACGPFVPRQIDLVRGNRHIGHRAG